MSTLERVYNRQREREGECFCKRVRELANILCKTSTTGICHTEICLRGRMYISTNNIITLISA